MFFTKLSPDAVARLREVLTGSVVTPVDAEWDAARQAWNLAVDQRPAAVVLPETAQDIVEAVRFATREGLRVAAQGTGHNAGPIVGLADAILIKTERMRGVQIDAEARNARVEAGAQWVDVVGPAGEHGLAALAGSAPDVGIVGYSLGGGIGWMARTYGMATNSVTAIEIVLADGSLVRADADHHSDLFWALRGGGGNFGVVTAMEFRLYDVGPLVAGALIWPIDRAADVLHTWRELTATWPESVTTSARLMRIPDMPDIPDMVRGRALVIVDGAVLGTRAEAEELLAPLRALEPEIDLFGPVAPPALSYIHMDPEDPVPALSGTATLDALPAEVIDTMIAAAGAGVDSPLLMVELRHLGGAVGRVPQNAGARATLPDYVMFAAGIPATPELGEAILREVGALKSALTGYLSPRHYLNFAEAPTDTATAFTAEDYARLRRVRAAVDPLGIFLANHPIG